MSLTGALHNCKVLVQLIVLTRQCTCVWKGTLTSYNQIRAEIGKFSFLVYCSFMFHVTSNQKEKKPEGSDFPPRTRLILLSKMGNVSSQDIHVQP